MIINQVPSYYSEEQLRAYLKRSTYPCFSAASSLPQPTLDTLRTVVLQHLLTYPFEHTEMHYCNDHIMNVEAQSLFNRLVEQGKGGSYCCGQNALLLGMLRALGYPSYAAGGRVNVSPDPNGPPFYSAISHAVLFAKPSDAPVQLVDVGFGGTGLVAPLELIEGAVCNGPPPEQHRLAKGVPSGAAVVDGTGWVLEWRTGNQPWRRIYQFSEAKLYPSDYDALSFAVCGRPTGGPFWADVMCMRIFEAEDGRLGRLTMSRGVIRRRLGDKLEVLQEVKTEQERISALKTVFGITVSDEEVAFMRERAPALPFS